MAKATWASEVAASMATTMLEHLMETSTGTTIARHQPFSGQSGHSATLFLRSVTIILAALFCTVIAMVPHSFANEQGRGNGNGNGNIGIGNGNGNNGNF